MHSLWKTAIISLKPNKNIRNRSERSRNRFTTCTVSLLSAYKKKEKTDFLNLLAPCRNLPCLFSSSLVWRKSHLKGWGKSHASLFGLKFWTFNLEDNGPTLEPIFGVEGRSIHLIILWKSHGLVWFGRFNAGLRARLVSYYRRSRESHGKWTLDKRYHQF